MVFERSIISGLSGVLLKTKFLENYFQGQFSSPQTGIWYTHSPTHDQMYVASLSGHQTRLFYNATILDRN